MPLSPTNALNTLTGIRDACARWLGASVFTPDLPADLQNFVNDAMALAMDRVTDEANWKWQEREGSFSTKDGYNAGTVTVTNRDATVVGAGTAFATDDGFGDNNVLVGDKFALTVEGYYRIGTVTDDTNLELAAPWSEADAAGASYQIRRDEYDLAAGLIWLRQITEINTARTVPVVGLEDWRRVTGGRFESGDPRIAIIIGADSTATENSTDQKIQLWPMPDADKSYVYTYQQLPTFTDATSAFGPQRIGLLIHATMTLVFQQMGDADEALLHEQRYLALLPNAKRRDVKRGRVRIRAYQQWGFPTSRRRIDGTRPFHDDTVAS